jgi:hypothetical protein
VGGCEGGVWEGVREGCGRGVGGCEGVVWEGVREWCGGCGRV